MPVLKGWISPCYLLNIISMESSAQLRNHRLRDLMPWPVWALHSLRTSKQKQDNSGHAQSSCQCSHLHTIKWSLFSICCVPLPLSRSPGLTFVENLWVRYSLTSYDLNVTRWGYSSCHWGNYDLNAVLSSEPLHAGDPCGGELLLSNRQIRWGLQLHKPREMQVKALSHRSVSQLV